MVFHSFGFIFVFLPVVYAGFVGAHRIAGWTGAYRFLVVASVVFYAQWSPAFAAVLVASVIANYAMAECIIRLSADRDRARLVLYAAIALNLAALVYFKYTNFLIDIAGALTGSDVPHVALMLPVGVSFYTFVQIGYLIEVSNGSVVRPDFTRYALFATFFPCVTAGPLVMQREMLEQMHERRDSAFDLQRLAVGLTMFGIGLFKKVLLADSIAPFADAVFNGAASGGVLTMSTAWIGALAYALQLYFDFSGYTDMALGLGFVFGLRLPLNFDSPFKATSISDFWRRWHMTMTRFFTTFIFTPLAISGIRQAGTRRLEGWRRFVATAGRPAVATFLVAGIWHGAGWTFVVYGLVHGCAIAINLAWRQAKLPSPPASAGWLMTMLVVVSALVLFRAPTLHAALSILVDMSGLGSVGVPVVAHASVVIDTRMALSTIVLLASIVLLLPNSQQILHRHWVSSDTIPASTRAAAGIVAWRPSLGLALGFAATISLAVASIGSGTSFLYYQF